MHSNRSSDDNLSVIVQPLQLPLPETVVTNTPPFYPMAIHPSSEEETNLHHAGRSSLSFNTPQRVQLTSLNSHSRPAATPSDMGSLPRGSNFQSSLLAKFKNAKDSLGNSFTAYVRSLNSCIVEPVPTVSRIDSGAVFATRADPTPSNFQYRPPSFIETVQSSVLLLAEDPEESTKRTIILFVVLCMLNALIGMAGDVAKSLDVDVVKTSQYVVTGFICVMAPVPWYGLGHMFKAMSQFTWKTHGMVTLCRFFYALNNVPTLYIIQECGGPIYQLTKLINILPIHIAYRVLLGKTYSTSIWLTAVVIVLFSALYTDLDNIGDSSGGTNINLMAGLPFIIAKIVARTFYTVLTDVLIKDVLPEDVDEIVKIQVFNFYDFWVCIVLAMVWWPDYDTVWGTSGWIFEGYSWGAFLVPMAEASYSFISLQVLAVLSGEALSISQGFALVILWCFNLVLNSAMGKELNVTFTSVFAIFGVAVTIVLYGIAVEKNKFDAVAESVIDVWHPMMDANSNNSSRIPGGSVTADDWGFEDSVFKSGKFAIEMLPKISGGSAGSDRRDSYLSNHHMVLAPANYVSPVPLPVPQFDATPLGDEPIIGEKRTPENSSLKGS